MYARSASTVTSKFQDGTDYMPLGAIGPVAGGGLVQDAFPLAHAAAPHLDDAARVEGLRLDEVR